VRVTPQEILADLRAGMLRRFLIGKYRLPPKGSQVKTQKVHPANRFSPGLGKKNQRPDLDTTYRTEKFENVIFLLPGVPKKKINHFEPILYPKKFFCL